MVPILTLLASVIDGTPYKHVASLVRSLPNSNDDFGFEFGAWSASTGGEANEPQLRPRTAPMGGGQAAERASTAFSASGR